MQYRVTVVQEFLDTESNETVEISRHHYIESKDLPIKIVRKFMRKYPNSYCLLENRAMEQWDSFMLPENTK